MAVLLSRVTAGARGLRPTGQHRRGVAGRDCPAKASANARRPMIPMLRRPALALLALVLAGRAPLAAQEPSAHIYQYPLRLVDLAIESSQSFGVGFYSAPSIQSKQGADSLRFVGLSFNPDTQIGRAHV